MEILVLSCFVVFYAALTIGISFVGISDMRHTAICKKGGCIILY